MWPRRLHVHQRPVGEKPAPISEADQALIAQAVAAGRVTVCAPSGPLTPAMLDVNPRAVEPEEIAELLRLERSA